jgi:hypothetical protein
MDKANTEIVCGETGIRTQGTLLAYTHFPGVLLRPLGHLSENQMAKCKIALPSIGMQRYLIFLKNQMVISPRREVCSNCFTESEE